LDNYKTNLKQPADIYNHGGFIFLLYQKDKTSFDVVTLVRTCGPIGIPLRSASITKNKRGHREIQHRFKLLVKIHYDISDE